MTSVALEDLFDEEEKDELEGDLLADDNGSSDIEIVDVVQVEEKEYQFENYGPETMKKALSKRKKSDEAHLTDSDSSDLPLSASEALKPYAKVNKKNNKKIKAAIEPKPTKPATKSGKKASTQTATTDTVVELTIYCHIAKPALANRKRKQPKEDSWLEKPGFKFASDNTYDEFLEAVARILPCDVDNLAVESFRWRPTKPASAKTLIIGNDDGYQALLLNARQDTKGRLILLYMDPPLKPAAPARQDVGTSAESAPLFDYGALACAKTTTHIAEQKATVNKQLGSVTTELEKLYPVGNVAGFPDKRVYVNKSGHMWELTKMRLNNWASHIIAPGPGQTGCDTENPPHTSHFDVDQRIRVPSKSKSTNSSSQKASPPSATPAPAVPSTPTPASSDASQLLAVVALKMLSDMNRKDTDREERNRHDETNYGVVADHPPPAVLHTPRPAPSPKKCYGVPLTDFCKHYDLSSEDESRLEKLRYRPGDKNIRRLEEVDWHDVGFQKLEWFSVLDAHDRFLNDVKTQVSFK
ncbi:hypothetical protein PQX77_015388 [Marasmius sp. AFHP31]|nr:hypothetical protein PQX77_015388 [Marasmius sp. AFHP31]